MLGIQVDALARLRIFRPNHCPTEADATQDELNERLNFPPELGKLPLGICGDRLTPHVLRHCLEETHDLRRRRPHQAVGNYADLAIEPHALETEQSLQSGSPGRS